MASHPHDRLPEWHENLATAMSTAGLTVNHARTREACWAIRWSFVALLVTALLQLVCGVALGDVWRSWPIPFITLAMRRLPPHCGLLSSSSDASLYKPIHVWLWPVRGPGRHCFCPRHTPRSAYSGVVEAILTSSISTLTLDRVQPRLSFGFWGTKRWPCFVSRWDTEFEDHRLVADGYHARHRSARRASTPYSSGH